MNEYKYTLEKGSRKHHCPACGKKSFVKYIDINTGNYLPVQYGRCDRESKCSYHLNPYRNGYATEQANNEPPQQMPKKWKTPQPVYFDLDTFKHTLEPARYEKNIFIQNLLKAVQFPFDIADVVQAIRLYRIGTIANGYRAGAITFPFIDINNNIRAVQVKQFNEQSHTTSTDFLHSILEKHYTRKNKPMPEWLRQYIQQDKRISCLFGEHILRKYPRNPVALVEAPKTAIYCRLYFGFPDNEKSLIWLAVYNKSSFSLDKIQVLKGRDIFVFPDLSKDGSTFSEWQNKAKRFEKQMPGTNFVFSDLLEKLAPERDKSEGMDIADYLIKQDWRLFRQQEPTEPKTKPQSLQEIQPLPEDDAIDFEVHKEPETQQSEDWSNEIAELEKFFNEIKLPTGSIKLNEYSTIIDANKYVSNHLNSIKVNNGNPTFYPALERLQAFKELLTTNLNLK